MGRNHLIVTGLVLVIACLAGCGDNTTENTTDQAEAPSTGPDYRSVEEVEQILEGSRWTWHLNRQPEPIQAHFFDGHYRMSDWAEGRYGEYEVIDGYRIELTDAGNETHEMLISADGRHFFMIRHGDKVRWGRKILDSP